MSFNATETSGQSGAPIEFFYFQVGGIEHRFTNHVEAYTLADSGVEGADGEYLPALIRLEELEDTAELAQLEAQIVTTRDNPVASAFRAAPPGFELPVGVFRMHLSDPDLEVINWLHGNVISCVKIESEARLTVEPPLARARRLGNPLRYQFQCNKMTYSEACGVNAADYTFSATVTDIDGAELTLSGLPTGLDESFAASYFVGGYVTTADGSRRFIVSQAGDTLRLMLNFDDLELGETVEVTAGDDRFHLTCQNKFGNIGKFFGFFTRPQRNPWKQGGLGSAGATGWASFPTEGT